MRLKFFHLCCMTGLLICSVQALAGAVAAPVVIRLWEGVSMPFSKPNQLQEREVHYWGSGILENITDPTITVFSPLGRHSGIGVLVIPGGNYSGVAIHHEGYDVARRMAEQGITAAVLKYRLPNQLSSDQPSMVPLSDSRRALKLMHDKARQFGIDPMKIGVMGFSAGGHLAALTTLWVSTDPDEQPHFSALIYGVTNYTAENEKWLEESLYLRQLTDLERNDNRLLEKVGPDTPPAFLVHAYDDQVCHVEESTLYAQQLFAHHIPVEMHLFERGGHGFGLGRAADGTDQWPALFVRWVKKRMQ
ncbi:alpha/beta hydrolase [Sapientia aquatica]|uniref:Alpha/beta hydrolase n=1 Tax=Sapientia aquatica TaxID=1549640 RepID=A0A4R5VQ47_9BURK|nr:alpha/beta hydrolase [Sapientia aquatica]TDK60445.1 alpha/beta hydrolase [Sapientia aquatica]